ncbi:hypothetical protein ANCCEY_08531 [Ancylostoma ceylanicum]|uniref:Glucuronosyltransferase n=1 Tax=Ancylostoma ceylanicum TaxID=53326 RepID=A0A0D6LMG2_9BILA|nr:hypothetical protein ANCCEY_08531 [Ancylostoma ceylanicum]
MIRVVFWLVLFTIVDAGKILVYSPSISYSHLISNGRIADALAKAGHDVMICDLHQARDTMTTPQVVRTG